MATRKSEYSEASIRVLKGLEPVRQRPGMYTRTDNPLHVVQEVVDRLHVDGIVRPRGSRSKRSQDGRPKSGFEPSATDDIVKSDEEGLTYIPPVAPPTDEED